MAMTPTSMSIDEATLERINEIQKETGLNRSGAIRLAVSSYAERGTLEKRIERLLARQEKFLRELQQTTK